jgi:hypothetical protein
MATLDLEEGFVFEADVELHQVRGWLNGENDLPMHVNSAFENAQAFVYTDKGNRAYVVLEIRK